jgi:glycosyltransferase involved in cell wall biosynthesis
MRELKTRGWSVRLWSLVGPDEPGGFAEALRGVADEIVLVPRKLSKPLRIARVARDTLARRAFQERWFWSPSSARAAAGWLNDVADEALFVQQLYMYPFVPRRLRKRIALDTQNHEAERVRAIARGDADLGRRFVARLQVAPVERFEREAMQAVGVVLAVSEAELEAFERVVPGRVRLVPNGVDVQAITPLSKPPASRELLFLGSLGYGANVDAVRYFSTEIAGQLDGSGASLTIVGSSPPGAVYEAAARARLPVTVAGFVPELAPYFSKARAMVVPLRHGGGTRLKILESLAWGLPVVTTSIGGAGLGLTNGQHALIADDPAAFAAAVERLLRDDDLWRRLSRAGRALVEERYDWRQIGDGFEASMLEVTARSGDEGEVRLNPNRQG